MFRRRFEHVMDEKGRASLPAPYRQALVEYQGEERIMVTQYFEGCLMAFPMDVWQKLEDKINGLDPFEKETRDIQRTIIGGAVDLIPDKQGRILIPSYLRTHAGLEQQIVFQGLADRFEIWSKERWIKEEVSPEQLSQSAKSVAQDSKVFKSD